MKIQIFSDTHLEAYASSEVIWKFIKPLAPVAIVAGDIDSRHFERTLTELAKKFERVIAVYGNHEFYHKDISWRPDFSQIPENVSILDRSVVEIDGSLIVGATLWSDFKNSNQFVVDSSKRGINDFHIISDKGNRFTPQAAAGLYQEDKQYINKILDINDGKKVVVVTHFIPGYQFVNPMYKGNSMDTLNYYFSANCEDIIQRSKVDTWVFGHSHSFHESFERGTHFISNPYGYPREIKTYRDLVIEV
jgi:predicted phosphodiesterase